MPPIRRCSSELLFTLLHGRLQWDRKFVANDTLGDTVVPSVLRVRSVGWERVFKCGPDLSVLFSISYCGGSAPECGRSQIGCDMDEIYELRNVLVRISTSLRTTSSGICRESRIWKRVEDFGRWLSEEHREPIDRRRSHNQHSNIVYEASPSIVIAGADTIVKDLLSGSARFFQGRADSLRTKAVDPFCHCLERATGCFEAQKQIIGLPPQGRQSRN